MDVADAEMVQRLAARDGLQTETSLAHTPERCRYRELYAHGDCPWCAASERRRLGHAVVLERPMRYLTAGE